VGEIVESECIKGDFLKRDADRDAARWSSKRR